LIDEYPQQWVAVYAGSVRAHAPLLGDVLMKLEELAIPPERAQIRFIDGVRRTMIL
jgi:hypothetical protein